MAWLVDAEQQALKKGKNRKEAIYAAYDRFYKGDIAKEFARGCQEQGGRITEQDLANWKVKIEEPVFHVAAVTCTGQSTEVPASTLPIHRGQPWTMNLFVRIDKPLATRTPIAGFGRPDNDAEGFGFRGINGSGWAQESHPFSSPSYGRVFPERVEYPFNHGCGTASETESDVAAWIYDSTARRSPPIATHLSCTAPVG